MAKNYNYLRVYNDMKKRILNGTYKFQDRLPTEAELEKQKAVDDVKKEMIAVASMMAGKIVSGAIDTTVQEGLIDETLKEMGESTWLS